MAQSRMQIEIMGLGFKEPPTVGPGLGEQGLLKIVLAIVPVGEVIGVDEAQALEGM
jgi:hypothetical protein